MRDLRAGEVATLRRLGRCGCMRRSLGAVKTETVPGDFARQLAETIAWCSARADAARPRDCLRSSELRPDLARHYDTEPRVAQLAQVELALIPTLETEQTPEDWVWLTPSLIEPVVHRRRELLAGRCTVAPGKIDLAGGRLLLSFYEYTDHDGATEYETSGYLDINDVPPWDTWVGDVPCTRTAPPRMKSIHTVLGGENVDRILVAWVPSQFAEIVTAAMKTEAMGMLAWSDELPTREHAFGVWYDLVPPWLRDLCPPADRTPAS